MRPQSTTSRLRLAVVVAVLSALFTWIFAAVLFRGEMFAFRDAGHFYYPLFQFIQSQWAVGRVPLWNPLENQGTPLLGNAACSVLYPGKLLFFLPIGFAWAYRLYVLGHLVLAAFWSYRLARHWNASIEAAGVSAISYTFCGNVLLQHANVIYLVGAAWLPAAMLATDNMLVHRKLRHAAALGAVLALMTLGGDPQMAYNAGLLATLYAFFFPPKPLASSQQHVKKRIVLLSAAAVVGLSLAAVQIIPSMAYAKKSDRAATETARSLYEIPTAATSDNPSRRIADGLLCRDLDSTTHHGRIYQFSVGPWRMAEYVWPNFSGRQYPTNRRWLEAVPAEGRLWAPSLYMGIIPLLLGISAMRFRRGEPSQRWLIWSALLAMLASFGWYGLGWLVEELLLATGNAVGEQIIGQPVGGLYWLMTVVLPGYVYFRYPAKLLAIAAVALSTLAARGWDDVFANNKQFRHWLAYLCLFSLLAAIIALAIRPCWHDWLSTTEPDVLFGPLDTRGAANDLLFSLLQTAAVCAIAWCLLQYAKNRRCAPAAMLVLVALDLAAANAWMVASAPEELWQTPSKIAQAIRLDQNTQDQSGPIRVWRHPIWAPPQWQTTSSPDRLAESVRWERDTMRPKHNLSQGIAIVDVRDTMMRQEYFQQLTAAGWPEIMDVTAAEYAILPEHESLPGGRRVECDVSGISLWHREGITSAACGFAN